VYTSLGETLFLIQIEAALPTTSPIIPQVFITLTGPRPVFVTLIHLPAMKRFLMFRLYNVRYGAQYSPPYSYAAPRV